MAFDYNALNNAYYNSAYQKQLGSQNKAKSFWDLINDPNFEMYDPDNQANVISMFASRSSVNPQPTPTYNDETQTTRHILNTPEANTAAPISGTTSVGTPAIPTPPPIAGNINAASLIPTNNPSIPNPISTNPLGSSTQLNIPTISSDLTKKRLSSFGNY